MLPALVAVVETVTSSAAQGAVLWALVGNVVGLVCMKLSGFDTSVCAGMVERNSRIPEEGELWGGVTTYKTKCRNMSLL